jgi:uncharacterized protein (TIGR02757 family)
MSDTRRRYRDLLEGLYQGLNRAAFIHPDPVEFLHTYDDPRDREVVGLVASCLAYGRVAQIMKSVSGVLRAMGPHPARFLMDTDRDELTATFSGFRHRFTTGRELALTLVGVRGMIGRYGSLEGAFLAGMGDGDRTVIPSLCRFSAGLNLPFLGEQNSLVPCPEKGSARKRLNLFLRWMVRKDEVDPGGWDGVSPAMLVVPLDTHLFRIAGVLGFTKRRSADLTAALEITAGFSEIEPDDPVKYDFCLTRLGIRPDLSIERLSSYGASIGGEEESPLC